jgi:hypothetical protein
MIALETWVIKGYHAFFVIKTIRLGTDNDPTPALYSIAFEGKQMDQSDQKSCTNYISTPRVRSSHTSNLLSQYLINLAEKC